LLKIFMRYILVTIFILITSFSFAQTSTVTGRVIDEVTKQPIKEASITIAKAKVTTSTDENGLFTIKNIPYGTYEVVISIDNHADEKMSLVVDKPITNLNDVLTKHHDHDHSTLLQDGIQTNEQAGADDDGGTANDASGQNVSSALNASRDPFLNAATFGWGSYFYKLRGYENDNSLLYLNGVPMNDLEEGGVQYNAWSGLNDVFRSRQTSLGLAATEYNIGGLGLNTSLDASASNQRKQTRVNYAMTNRAYRNRIMFTHSSGLNKNGWAYSFSFSRRWANEGQIKGTFYDAFGYFGAIEKRWNGNKSGLSLMVVGAPLKRGKTAPSFKESFELTGTNYYNPNWGYQNGKVRNTRVLNANTPLFILTHDAQLTPKTTITTAVALLKGETSTTILDRYNSNDTRPDYYKNMPFYMEDAQKAEKIRDIKEDPENNFQVNWDDIYEGNELAKIAGQQASFVLGADVEKTTRVNVGINLQTIVNDHLVFYNGLTFQDQVNHNFKRVEDLLGGLYYTNINQFSDFDFNGSPTARQYDLNNPNKIVKEGDTYNYNYKVHFQTAGWFSQAVFTYNKFDFFAATEIGYNNFYREGVFKSGIHPTNSFGNSGTNRFFNVKSKGGLTYKINGRNYLYVNGAIGNRAPKFDNTFVSPRVTNIIVNNPGNEKYQSLEVGYIFRTPFVKAKATGYVTDVKNATDIKRYFGYFTGGGFINEVLTNINKRYMGLELGVEVKVSPSLSVTVASSMGQAFFTNRPTFNQFTDNDTFQTLQALNTNDSTSYVKNYYLNAGPQTAAQLGLNYRSKKFWYATLSVNFLDRNFKDFVWSKRTQDQVGVVDRNSQLYQDIIAQEKLPSFYTVDLFGGKSFKVNKYIKKASSQTLIYFNLGISNILNNQNIIQYGFENPLLYKLDNKQSEPLPNSIQSKYAYALGLQYLINISLKF
jgi:hypothetical protein